MMRSIARQVCESLVNSKNDFHFVMKNICRQYILRTNGFISDLLLFNLIVNCKDHFKVVLDVTF